MGLEPGQWVRVVNHQPGWRPAPTGAIGRVRGYTSGTVEEEFLASEYHYDIDFLNHGSASIVEWCLETISVLDAVAEAAAS